MSSIWTPEKLARFIEVNGYDPTTQEGIIKHIDDLMLKLHELSNVRDAWQERVDLPIDIAQQRWEEAHKDVMYWANALKEAKALLGELVYNAARPVTHV